jgi:tetratricopeptide (TPR) repeat protein
VAAVSAAPESPQAVVAVAKAKETDSLSFCLQEYPMRILALCSLAVVTVLGLNAPASAKEPAWCAAYRTGGTNCGFNTYDQCMAAVSGVGGFCNRNPFAEPEKSTTRKEQLTEPKPRRKEKEEEKERAAPAPKPVAPPAAAQPVPAIVQPAPPVSAQPPAAPAPSTQQLVSNFQTARALILSGKYDAGIAAMKALGYDDHPDVAGSIGFAYAKLGNLNEARTWYNKALAADPNHLSTWNYSGALYVAQGDIAKARADLERIKTLCGGATCREYQELEALIAAKAR